MTFGEINAITGAFSYTGKYITRRLLDEGKEVRTLTGHPNNPNPFGEQVQAYPFNFDQPDELVKRVLQPSIIPTGFASLMARSRMSRR